MKQLRSWLIVMFVLGGVAVFAAELEVSKESPQLDGRQLFLDARCQGCHAVSSAGIESTAKSKRMEGPDLIGLASQRDRAWMISYLLKEKDLDGKSHMLKFKGSDEELQALVDWLLEQKAK